VARAAKIPFGFAILFSVYGLTIGKTAAQTMGLSPYAIVATYLGIAVAVTVLIILFGTWATSRLRGAVLGYFAAALLSLVLYLTVFQATDLGVLTPLQVLASMLTFGFLGAWVGLLYWEPRDKG
jgi:hypothetical protein